MSNLTRNDMTYWITLRWASIFKRPSNLSTLQNFVKSLILLSYSSLVDWDFIEFMKLKYASSPSLFNWDNAQRIF